MPRWLGLWLEQLRSNQGLATHAATTRPALTNRPANADVPTSAGRSADRLARTASGVDDQTNSAGADFGLTESQLQVPLCHARLTPPEANVNSWSEAQLTPLPLQRRQRFLVVEDEQDIADLIALHLSDLHADVTTVQDGAEGLNRALQENWDAILLDLRLPNVDGLDVCRALRARASYVPIMMLTSRSTELDRVLGLEIGADDYLTKPFSVAEMKARVKALVRRSRQAMRTDGNSAEQLQRDNLFLDKARHLARLADTTLDLTAKEFDLLWHFASSPGKVFKRSELLDQVWGYGHDGYQHTVNSHINRLRAKLEKDPGKPYFIETIWGVGYRFRDDS